MGLQDEIKPVSKEMFQSLAGAFSSSHKAMCELRTRPKMINTAIQEAYFIALSKYAMLGYRYSRVTFLTGWYWKRQMEKVRTGLDKLIATYREWHDSCKES